MLNIAMIMLAFYCVYMLVRDHKNYCEIERMKCVILHLHGRISDLELSRSRDQGFIRM